MNRRDFLRTGLLLGTAGLLPTTGLPAITESALSTTGDVQAVDAIPKARNLFRKFFHYGRDFLQSTPPEGTHPIWVAAVNKDWETLKQCLDQDPSLITMRGTFAIVNKELRGSSYSDFSNITLLHVVATWSDNVEALQYLISLGMDVNIANDENVTPLHTAVTWTSNMDVVKYLISAGADVNARTTSGDPEIDGRTPLYYAILASEIDVAKYLISNGANVNRISVHGDTALHLAAKYSSDLDFMKYLVSQGGDVHYNSKRLLRDATKYSSNIDVLNYLVSQGLDVARTYNNETMLHIACENCATTDIEEFLKFFIARGVDVNAKDDNGDTPLHTANEWRRKEHVDYLISQGADIHAKNNIGMIPQDYWHADIRTHNNIRKELHHARKKLHLQRNPEEM